MRRRTRQAASSRRDLIDRFGWSVQALCGFLLMIAIYAVIVWATRFTFAAQRDGWCMSRRARVAILLGVAVLFSLLVLSSVGAG